LPSGFGEGLSKESVDEGSAGANAKKEKAFGGLWNPGSRGALDQTAVGLSAPYRMCAERLVFKWVCSSACELPKRLVNTGAITDDLSAPEGHIGDKRVFPSTEWSSCYGTLGLTVLARVEQTGSPSICHPE
jgi:hypothetical protein